MHTRQKRFVHDTCKCKRLNVQYQQEVQQFISRKLEHAIKEKCRSLSK